MRLIVGLGNPGTKYQNTRHNVGWMALDELAHVFKFEPFKEVAKHKALLAEGQINGEKVLLAKPLTFMNLSGQSVRSLMTFYKIEFQDLLVIYDDVAIDSGTLRLRASGSAGGHNGMKSLIQELGTQEFSRLRIGIKPLEPFLGDLSDYVLGRFSEEEWEILKKNFNQVTEKVAAWLMGG